MEPKEIVVNLIAKSPSGLVQITGIEFCIECNKDHYNAQLISEHDRFGDHYYYLHADAFNKANILDSII